ncbi:uncharacterized protein [Typha latifolia]|uniref:uncharacterized protein n=1 Tax=Typha latifolia TaxID=4733 RepID=UPI003C2E4BA3
MLQNPSFHHKCDHQFVSLRLLRHQSCLPFKATGLLGCGNLRSYRSPCRMICMQLPHSTDASNVKKEDKDCGSGQSNLFLCVQTVRNFPVEKLYGQVVMVRFDSNILLESLDSGSLSLSRTLSTIKHLHNAGAKVLLVSSWGQSNEHVFHSSESLADYLSSFLHSKVVAVTKASGFKEFKMEQLEYADIFLLENLAKFREEVANCLDFSDKLASGVTVFVNDAFSLSHKILASTVGVARFCHASLAGFHFEEELVRLKRITDTTRNPYFAIIGGSNFLRKTAALQLLASKCDGLFFVGKAAFQVMNGLGLSVPAHFVESDAVGEALKLIQLAHSRKIPIYYPTDLWCVNDDNSELLEIFQSDEILTGWTPTDLGPMSLKKMSSLFAPCKKIIWIGPTDFGVVKNQNVGAQQLALVLERISKSGCDVLVVGGAACKAVAGISSSLSQYTIFNSASVVWEFLKGRTLPAVAALDKAYPYDIRWNTTFSDATRPLVVDVGSGNGLFLLRIARRWKDSNFLGLEINEKLVRRCLNSVVHNEMKNIHFISTNATSTFRSIISSYPGNLVLVTIQCPNPDFNREDHRWRMVQRTLVEAIIELLETNGKIFLQSDIKAVVRRMKRQFISYGKGKVVTDGDEEMEWLEENPFGVRSDWEQHVLARGAPMYRTMLRKAR